MTGQVTRESDRAPSGGVARQTPAPAGHATECGWLTSSDSIGHGRFTPGTMFDGRYRIVGLLGRGGMGEVYRADDLRLGQPVALKLLPEGLGRDPVRLAQFHNEVRTARQVSHPNVCRVYDIGETNGLLYLSMEYVDGEDLASSLRRIGRFPEDRGVEIARQLCAGVAAAHQRGVIHRDLKPANVMLDGAGRVRVMDFGLAAVGAVENVRAGTPAYMAPEQLLGREVTARSDIFALGLVLYELFTGRRAFAAATVDELVRQHESRSLTPPSTIVAALDAAVERAILRCLEPDPEDRPSSALQVSAALPGGDPLAAALAAGETPSPEMVAAAGQGVATDARVAWAVLVAVVAGALASFGLAVRTSPLDRMRPQYSAEVLAQRARDAVQRIGYTDAPRDDAHGFAWDQPLAEALRASADGARPLLPGGGRPSPLSFWYRQSQEPLTAVMFHSDLLTPGLVRLDDPPPITAGMVDVVLDYTGLLTSFEAIPPQRQDAPVPAAPVDWGPLFTLAGLDPAALSAAEPLWNFLAAADTRAAWTGAWPGTDRPMRVEAAALGGRPTAFRLVDESTRPARMPLPADDDTATAIVLLVLAISIVAGSVVLARKNLHEGRGDRRGASRLAVFVVAIMLALWACQTHVTASPVFFAIFLLAVCTSVFYGVLHWMLYMALEPFVRRHWPQVLVSLTNLLSGRSSNPVVGRDVLWGTALGVFWALLLRVLDASPLRDASAPFPGALDLLLGVRASLGVVLEEAPYAIRNALLYFFLLVVLRVVLRRQWIAAAAFAALFGVLGAIGEDRPLTEGLIGFVYFGMGALAILRWGVLTLAVGSFVLGLLVDIPVTLDTSAWYFGNMMLLAALIVGLAAWAAYTATAGRLVKVNAFD